MYDIYKIPLIYNGKGESRRMKSKNTSISFYCFLASIVVFILANMMGKLYDETGFSIGIGNDYLGYSILASISIIPLVGLIFGLKGEKVA